MWVVKSFRSILKCWRARVWFQVRFQARFQAPHPYLSLANWVQPMRKAQALVLLLRKPLLASLATPLSSTRRLPKWVI